MRRLYIIFIKRNTIILDKLKHLILLFAVFTGQFINAQQTVTLDETVFVHTNAAAFVSGETLLYKVYCLKSSDKTPSNISKIAYVELVDDSKKSVFKTKIVLENTTGQGDYFIPTTLKTGSYKLLGYTNWTLNKPTSELFQIDITIINPFKADESVKTEKTLVSENVNSSADKTVITANENSVTNTNVKLNLAKRIFENRELVDLKIETENPLFLDGNYSLSVRKIDNLTRQTPVSATEFATGSNNTTVIDLRNQSAKVYLPELRGEIISGKIIAKNSTDNIKNIFVALSLPGNSFAFEITRTDAQGNFIFNIKNIYYTPNINVQVINDNASNYNLTVNNNSEIEYSELSFAKAANLSIAVKETLLDRTISSQVENAYYHKKADNISKTPVLEPFYFPLAKEYVLDDFTRFKSLRETLTEVTTEIYTKQKGDKFYLHVNDPSIFPQLPESALVLIDGLYLENVNELINYNMKNIYKMDLIVGRYYVGAKSFNGLVSFTTFNKDFISTQTGSSIVKTAILRPQPKKIYNKIDYTNPADNERIPDFRNQLFWSPEVKLNTATNTFFTSDVAGTFEIRLEGFAKNGSAVSLKEIIEVKDPSANP